MITVGSSRRHLMAAVAVAVVVLPAIGRPGAAETAPKAEIKPQGKPQILSNVSYPDSLSPTFSADGRYMLVGNSRGTVRLWEAATGRLVRSFVAQSTDDRQYVRGIGFSDRLDVVVSNDRYGSVSIWRASTGQLLRTVSAGDDNPQEQFVFTADGKRVLSATIRGEIRVWDTATWKSVRTIKAFEGDVAFSPDGKLALVRGETAIAVFDVGSGRQVWKVPAQETGAGAFSADGARVAIGSGDRSHLKDRIKSGTGTIKVLDAKTGREVATLSYESQRADVWSLAFSGDGARLFSASADGVVRHWDVAGSRLAGSATADANADIQDALLSPGGDRLWMVDGSDDIKMLNAQTGAPIAGFGVAIGNAGTVAFVGASGRSSGDTGTPASILSANINFAAKSAAIHRWNVANGRLLGGTVLDGISWNDYALSLKFASDGSFAVSGTAEAPSPDDKPGKPTQPSITVWNLTTGKSMATLPGKPEKANIAVSADGRLIFSIDAAGNATLWNRTDGSALWTVTVNSDGNIFNCAAFSANGNRIAIGGDDGVRIVDAASGNVLRYLEEKDSYGISAVAFAPDGRTLIAGNGDWQDNASIWDAETGKRLHTLHGHAKVVSAVAYAPDSKRVATGGQDGTGRIWNAATGAQERVLRLDSASPFQSLTYSTDGTRVISGHADGSVAIWNSATGALIVTLVASADGEWAAITPEGFFDASPKGSQLLHVVNGLEVVSIDQVFQNLFRPDLVREKLAGDPQGKVREAAAKLDLAKVLASGAPPTLRILQPSAGQRAQEDHAGVKIELAARDGGIGRVEWRVDGVTRAVDRSVQNAAAATVELDHTFPLEQGDTVIDVVAYNAKNLLASAPAQVTIRWDGVSGASPPRLFVLAVGINDYYDSRLRLKFATPDAKSLSSALAAAGRNLFPAIKVATALDQEATRDNIESVFTKLVAEMKPSDVFLFFIVGHGATIDGRYYFLPYDFRYDDENSVRDKAINQDQLQAWFSMIPAKKSMLIFDTCESGSMTQDIVATRGLEHLVALERLTQGHGPQCAVGIDGDRAGARGLS